MDQCPSLCRLKEVYKEAEEETEPVYLMMASMTRYAIRHTSVLLLTVVQPEKPYNRLADSKPFLYLAKPCVSYATLAYKTFIRE